MSYHDYIENIINNQAFLNTESGIVFEFTAANANQTYTSMPFVPDNLGFSDVSAIAVYNILPSVLNNLFYFQLSSSLDISNINSQVIKYGINTTYLFNIIFSQSLLTYTNFTVNDSIRNDYVTYLAYSITGIKNRNIFSNTGQLLEAVTNLDSGFNNTINQNIAFSGLNNSNPFLSNDTTNPFIRSAKQLVIGMLTMTNSARRQVFYNDLISQSTNNNQNIYWVPFHQGDIMSILINYLSTYPSVYPRNYKILLKCESQIVIPNNVSNVGINLNGNLDPFYVLKLLNESFNQMFNLDASFVSFFNANNIPIYKEIGYIVNVVDLYYKTFLSNIRQPSLLNENGIMNNGINPSFQYIYLNSTITTLTYPSLRSIKQSLITSPYNMYVSLNDIQDIQCDLNSNIGNFIIRIYTRPVYTSIDNSLNINDSFYGNYYNSRQIEGQTNYTTYHLGDLFPSWSTMLNTSYNQTVYYFNGLRLLKTLGEQEILSICILTLNNNVNIGIKNIIVTYNEYKSNN